MYRLLNIEPSDFSPEAAAILARVCEVEAREMDRNALLAAVSDRHILWTRLAHQIDEEVLAHADRLMAVATATTGLDHVELEAAARRGVAVLSLAGETEFLSTITATAELAWGLVLSLVRRIPFAFEDVRGGQWRRDRFRGNELAGKALGIVGVGRLGKIVARYGKTFGMTVLGCDPNPSPELDTFDQGGRWRNVRPANVVPAVGGGGGAPPLIDRWLPLGELLAAADVVTLHVPLTDETRGMIDRARLASMKPTAILVNTSRGPVVDEPALVLALEAGTIAGAALDVICAEEALRSGSRRSLDREILVDHSRRNSNLILTPHIGGAARESLERAEVFLARKIARFLGQPEGP